MNSRFILKAILFTLEFLCMIVNEGGASYSNYSTRENPVLNLIVKIEMDRNYLPSFSGKRKWLLNPNLITS